MGIGEGGRPLDGLGAGDEEIDCILGPAHAPHAHDGQVASAARVSCTARTATGCSAGPDSPPGISSKAGSVLTRVTADAPAPATALATAATSGTAADSFAHRGRPPDSHASTTCAASSGEWANWP